MIIDSLRTVDNKADLTEGMHSLMRLKPNTHLIGLQFLPRLKLWKYNSRHKFYAANPEHESIRERKVEAPVLINKASLRFTDSTLKQYMVNYGYYYSEVSDSIIPLKNQEAQVLYTVLPGKKYYIKDVRYNIPPETGMLFYMNKYKENSFLKKGQPFRNVDFGLERERIYKVLRENGYYSLKIENIWPWVDTINRDALRNVFDNPFGITTELPKTVSAYDSIIVDINITPTRDSSINQQFKIDRVYVKFTDPFHKPKTEQLREVMYKDVLFQYYDVAPVHMNIIHKNIFINHDELFSTSNIEKTYNRLNQLSTFQFVDIQFAKSKKEKYVDCYIELTLAMKRDIKANVDLSTGEDYLAGFGGGLNFSTKNLLHGANKLNLSTQYTLETRPLDREDLSKGVQLSANNFSASANLTLPRFLVPFRYEFSRNNTPFTVLSIAHSRVNRIGSFKLANTTAKFSYSWKESSKKNWLLSPAFLSFTQVPQDKLSVDFRNLIENSAYLRNTYSNNLIEGESVNFGYRSDLSGTAPSSHVFNFGLEEAGLLMQGLNAGLRALSNNEITPVAHYVRAEADYRYYYKKRKYQWASRAMVGIGMPTFGDISLPYIKQYSQGGAFSNRGWQLRNLGPGRTLPDTLIGLQLLDRTGDLKLELNTELRFPLTEFGPFTLEGAYFVDAGNIWLVNTDSTNVGGEFRLDKFWPDIAVSSGFGIRFDFSFFIFRIDHAWRLKYPYKPENAGWDLRGLRLNDGQWNVAIGYPF